MVLFDYLLADGKPEPGPLSSPLIGIVELLESFKEPFPIRPLDDLSLVGH